MNFPNKEKYLNELNKLSIISKDLMSTKNAQYQIDKDIKIIDRVGHLLPKNERFIPLTFKEIKKKDRLYMSTDKAYDLMREYSLYGQNRTNPKISDSRIIETINKWIFKDIVIRTAVEKTTYDNNLFVKLINDYHKEQINSNVSYLHFKKINDDIQIDHYIFNTNNSNFTFEESYYFPEWSINFITLFYYEYCSQLLSYKSKKVFLSSCLIASKETNNIYVPCKFFSNYKYNEMTPLEKRMCAMPIIIEDVHSLNMYLLDKFEDREKTYISVKKDKSKTKTKIDKDKTNENTETVRHIIMINDEIKLYSSTNEVIREFRTRRPCNFEFGVRGHVRHYKSGKVIWIEPYTKNKGKGYNSKSYMESNT